MDYFLLKSDYYHLIQQEKLDIVITSDESMRTDAEVATEQEIKSYLRQRYDMDLVFAPLQDWQSATKYYWGDRVYLTADAFDATATYATNDRVLYQGNVYYSTAGSGPAAWDAMDWTLIAAEGHYQMQADLWDEETAYSIGNTVRRETTSTRKWYKALTANTGADPDTDDGTNWVEVESQTGEVLTNTDYWVVGDSRNQHLKMIVIDIVLYHLHSRINPRNIPEFRITRKEDAISYLKMIARGTISADLELIFPESGNNIVYGSQPVQNNFY